MKRPFFFFFPPLPAFAQDSGDPYSITREAVSQRRISFLLSERDATLETESQFLSGLESLICLAKEPARNFSLPPFPLPTEIKSVFVSCFSGWYLFFSFFFRAN